MFSFLQDIILFENGFPPQKYSKGYCDAFPRSLDMGSGPYGKPAHKAFLYKFLRQDKSSNLAEKLVLDPAFL
jgi:hypothetical protein